MDTKDTLSTEDEGKEVINSTVVNKRGQGASVLLEYQTHTTRFLDDYYKDKLSLRQFMSTNRIFAIASHFRHFIFFCFFIILFFYGFLYILMY